MKEIKQMLWMVLGVVGGFSLGGVVLLLITQATGNLIPDNPTLALFVYVPILGGGLIGGGYLAQWLLHRREKAQRKRRQAEKDKSKPRGGNRKKK